MISRDLTEGDDIQHAINHFGEGKIHLSSGTYTNLSLNMKDCQLVIDGATLNGCHIENIKMPIQTKGNAGIIGCSLYASPEAPALFEV